MADSAPAVDAVVSPRTATATASVGAVAVVVANAEVVEGKRAALGQLVTQGLITLDIAANLDGLISFCERVAELVQRIIP